MPGAQTTKSIVCAAISVGAFTVFAAASYCPEFAHQTVNGATIVDPTQSV